MEIHAPHQPILSLREALVHLAIVTVGIVIALSFEGVREYYEHRALAAEARENITRELRDNGRELDEFLKGMPRMESDLTHAHDLLIDMAASGKTPEQESVHIGFGLASLSTASRTTAQVTGAFGFMPYAEVKKYALVYDLQAKFVQLQDAWLSDYASALALVWIFEDASKARPGEIETLRHSVDALSASLYVQRQIGEELAKAYKGVGEH
jgi:hypothetical protein